MKKFFKKLAATTLAAALVLPAGIAGAAPMFPDVNPNTVTPDVQQAIESLAAQGIINGFPDGTFGPNKAITRAQFAKILAQVQGLTPNPAASAHFTDVKDPEQQGWVGALYAAGLTTGTTATTYSPNRPIQRDQAATFLVRALELTEVANTLNLTPNTTDGARINDSHRANVGLLEKVGLIRGFPDGSFGPGEAFKRQQAANLLHKIQQNRDEYISAAKSLVNNVEVTRNEDGTLTVKGFINGAATVDVVITEAAAAGTAKVAQVGDVLFEQKGVQTENGEFEITTNTPIFQENVDVTVTGYDEDGNVIEEVKTSANVGEAEVQGYTEAPDLIQAYSDGKYVYFVFDEEIKRIEDEDAFFVVSFAGRDSTRTFVEPSKVRIDEDNPNVAYADFYNPGTPATSTLAGVRAGAVSDSDGNESVEASVPLNSVRVGGTTAGPDLKSVRIESFNASSATFTVEFEFDEKLKVIDAAYANKFKLYNKEGESITGTTVSEKNNTTVIVEFDNTSNWDSRDRIARAVVEGGAVEDTDTNYGGAKVPNPLTAVDARTKLSTNYLRSADINVKDGEITYTFNRNVEDVITSSDAGTFGLNLITGQTVQFSAADVDRISINKSKVTVKLEKDNADNAIRLANAIAAVVFDKAAADPEESIVTSVVDLPRSFSAGESASPLLDSIKSSYDRNDELLTVTFRFTQEIRAGSADSSRFVLVTADGERFRGDRIDDEDGKIVVVEFDIEEEDLEDVVLVAVEEAAVEGKGYYHRLINPAANLPLDR